MHRTQYEALRQELGLGLFDSTVVPDDPPSLYITCGRQKGKLGRVLSIGQGKITVQSEPDQIVTLPYTKLERINPDGSPIYQHPLDITGRAVTGTCVICYSVRTGADAHALEIGRVVKTNPSGTLMVQPVIRNGERLSTYCGGPYPTRLMVRAERVIILPVDATLVTTWVLSGFDVYRADDLLR